MYGITRLLSSGLCRQTCLWFVRARRVVTMERTGAFTDRKLPAYFVQILICLMEMADSGHPSRTDVRQYCNADEFSASCGSGTMIFMEHAKYGSMEKGRCLRDPRYIGGCGTDVLSIMDSICSGRTSCQFRIPEGSLKSLEPCPKELAMYLEASYSCLPVEKSQNSTCRIGIHITTRHLSGSSANRWGYLGNWHQSISCRWIVTAEKGQQVKITLYDFTTGHHPDKRCRRYAVARDLVGSKHDNICGGSSRVREVFQSVSNSVELETFSEFEQKKFRFVLKYEAVGCSDPVVGSWATVTRQETQAIIGCNFSDVRHTLQCQDNAWVGDQPTCPSDGASSMGQSWGLHSFWQDGWGSSKGLLTVIILGVALGVVLGVLMLAPVLFYFKRRDLERRTRGRSWPDGPETDVDALPGYNGLLIQDPQRKLGGGVGGVEGGGIPGGGGRGTDGGGLRANSIAYYEDRKCAYNFRNSKGPGSPGGVVPIQDCFMTTTPGCRWAVTGHVISSAEFSKENSGDYEYPN